MQCYRAAQLVPKPSSWETQKEKETSEAGREAILFKAAQSVAEQTEFALDA